MINTQKYRDALMARLGELDKRLHAIESELDSPKSRCWSISARADRTKLRGFVPPLGGYGTAITAPVRPVASRLRPNGLIFCPKRHCAGPVPRSTTDTPSYPRHERILFLFRLRSAH